MNFNNNYQVPPQNNSKKKKIIIAVVMIAILIVAGVLWKVFLAKGWTQGIQVNSNRKAKTVTNSNYKEPFMWGVHVNPSSVANYKPATWRSYMNRVSDLGAKWIRLPFDNTPKDKFKMFDQMVDTANKKGINVYLLLSSSKPVLDIDNTYEDGYRVADEISKHYKDKVRYYQLMSEQGSTALKGPEFSGTKESDYDAAKYEKVREWIRGASDAIRKNSPNSYVVVTDQWLHYYYIEMLTRDKVSFDVIGWDWFGDMEHMSTKKLEDGSLFIDKLKSFNKPLILAEVNGRPSESGMDEQKQSDFIENMGDWAYNSGVIKGFFVHELFDMRPTTDHPNGDKYGLIKINCNASGKCSVGDKRKAYYTYQELIGQYSK